jgi:probable F420-dependent oxidoreductase
MTLSGRWGLTIPLAGVRLPAHADLVRALPSFGYTDAWSAETAGADAFTPLALAAAWTSALRLGTAIVPVFTRGPALIAMSAAALADAAPGRFVLGLGASSPVIVGNWNGVAFDRPYQRTRDVLRFVRAALAGERVDGQFQTFSVRRFKLDQPPAQPPPILLAALRPQMLALAGREADGAILNWLSAGDVAQCQQAIANADAEVLARIFVCPTEDAEHAHAVARTVISTYLTVPAYAAFHDWLGRGATLAAMHRAWAAGDRAGAAAAIPEAVLDELVVHGSPEACRAQVQAYVQAGVHTPILALLPTPEATDAAALREVVRGLGPEA